MKDLLRRHPGATTIWAHAGLGRVVHPVQGDTSGTVERHPDHVAIVEAILTDPAFAHVHFDISWNEVAKYLVGTPEAVKRAADVINRFPDRFLFGTDEVAPRDEGSYLRVYRQYAPLWDRLTPETSEKVRKGNYERIFDAARAKVRAWEKANLR
jgi:hypothetical protein